MVPLTIDEIVKATGGKLVNQGQPGKFVHLATDSRQVVNGALFVALKGERYDGHSFVKQALANGAAGLIVEASQASAINSKQATVVAVVDTREALLKIAALIKSKLHCRTVGITGSNGKTTVKELATNILQQQYETASSPFNYNNEIGLPLTLAKAKVDVEFLILELAMRGRGQIKQLAAVAQPEIGVITNIGVSHLELLGSLKNIAQAKLELVEALPPDGLAILNCDDDWFNYLKARTAVKILTFGLNKEAEVRASNIKLDDEGRACFSLFLPDGQSGQVQLNLLGRHNVYNALAAATVGFAFNLPIQTIITGLQANIPAKMRLELVTLKNGAKIINDAYNSSPASVEAALQVLTDVKAGGKKFVVLGPMAELGRLTEDAHKEVGKKIVNQNVDFLVTVGETAGIAATTVESMSHKIKVFRCQSVEEAGEFLTPLIKKDDLVLVKGSRVAGLEQLVKRLAVEV